MNDLPSEPIPVGYRCGDWVTPEQMTISVADDGFRFAATAVERLRTYSGQIFQLAAHLSRWRRTLDAIGIAGQPSDDSLPKLLAELLRRNCDYVAYHGDVGITVLATPGIANADQPTLAIQLQGIDQQRVRQRRQHGQRVIITDIVQPAPESWPRDIKVRCRLHYYLADRIARSSDPDATGLLLDDDRVSITETSIANVAIVKSGEIVSPAQDRILKGVTQQVAEWLAQARSIPWSKRWVAKSELYAADEILLMGTDTGIWFSDRVDQCVVGDGSPGPIYSTLLRGFDDVVSGKIAVDLLN